MRLVRQTRLRSVRGTTTSVFEVDMCEVGSGAFVVNFRFGKKGKRFTEGTKTTRPVGRDEAERIFLDVVARKKRNGYVDASAPVGGLLSPPPPAAAVTPPRKLDLPQTSDARATRLLGYLASPKTCSPQFPLRRVIWRVGELRISEAAPLLRELLTKGHRALKTGRGEPAWQYGLLWALARCRDPANVPLLYTSRVDPALPAEAKRVALLGLLEHLEGEHRDTLLDELRRGLPSAIAETTSDADALRAAVAAHLQHGPEERHDVLLGLYLMDTPVTRAIVLEQLATIALARPGFRTVRHIFKAAELREDGETYGVLTRRFELTRAGPGSRWGPPRPDLAYQPGTRRFLRRRSWRTLRRLGELEADGFLDLASGVLLAFGDEDVNRGRNALPWSLGQLLYGAHPRAYCDQGPLLVSISPEHAADTVRGEAFSRLWDRHPTRLVPLMLHGRSRHVHLFAARAFRAHPDAWSLVGKQPLLRMLGQRYQPTVRLAADIVIGRHDTAAPDLDLVLALACCSVVEARATAMGWVVADTGRYLTDVDFAVGLVLSPHDDVRQKVRSALASTLLPVSTSAAIVAKVLAELLRGEQDEGTSKALGPSVASLLTSVFSAAARTLSLDVIGDLLEHPHEGVQHLGATLLLGHDIRPADLPPDLLATAMLSAHPSVRAVGVRLFGELPDATLMEREAVLVDLCANPHDEVRQAVRPIVGRLCRRDPRFAQSLLLSLLELLVVPEAQEGMHAELVALIRAELQGSLHGLELAPIWTLLHTESGVVAELGGALLERNVDASALEVWRMAKLASHDILAVRQASWRMFQASLPRLRADMSAAVLVLDAKWDDSRDFAFDLFEQHFGADDFTPTLLVSLCDGVRPDVQQFGRRLITRFFAEADGQAYLTALSQHPTADMQLFATHYLERFAAGNADRIRALQPYFRSVLCRINKGRVAKKRVLEFLRREALTDHGVATDVAALLTELSLTIAVEYRAAAIDILNAIRTAHPDIGTPLTVRVPPRRGQIRGQNRTQGADAV